MTAGADSRYTVAPSSELGYSSPIVEITGVGASPQKAVQYGRAGRRCAQARARPDAGGSGASTRNTRSRRTRWKPPAGAELRASGQARTLVAVLALGAILLFFVVSVADALSSLRTDRWEREAGSCAAG